MMHCVKCGHDYAPTLQNCPMCGTDSRTPPLNAPTGSPGGWSYLGMIGRIILLAAIASGGLAKLMEWTSPPAPKNIDIKPLLRGPASLTTQPARPVWAPGSTAPSPSPIPMPPPNLGIPQNLSSERPAKPRLQVTWRDGTAELQQLAAQLTEQEAALVGLSVVLTGTDVYAARVRLTNMGDRPISITPQEILIHFGGESAVVTTLNHSLFLQPSVVEPGFYVEGLVMYRARLDIGAAMRQGGGTLSYNDNAIDVR